MENEVRKKLVVELYNRIKKAQYDASYNNLYAGLQGKIRGKGQEHFQIMEFYLFLKENPNLTDEEIREVLNSNNKFVILRTLDKKIPNLLKELKDKGPVSIMGVYRSLKETQAINVGR